MSMVLTRRLPVEEVVETEAKVEMEPAVEVEPERMRVRRARTEKGLLEVELVTDPTLWTLAPPALSLRMTKAR